MDTNVVIPSYLLEEVQEIHSDYLKYPFVSNRLRTPPLQNKEFKIASDRKIQTEADNTLLSLQNQHVSLLFRL
jgi:hypothetical protein